MVDQIRLMSDLLTLYGDNTAGDISAQDGRDHILSAMNGAFGGVLTVAGSDSQTVSPTAIKMTQFNTDGPNAQGVTPNHVQDEIVVNRKLTYFLVGKVSFTGTAGQEYFSTIRVNGLEDTSLAGVVNFSNQTDFGTLINFGLHSSEVGDKYEMFVSRGSGSGQFAVTQAAILVIGIGEAT